MKRAFLVLMIAAIPCGAYSALSHEAVVDSVWKSHIVPLLREKFPAATPDDLERARAYAYGGGQIQDMGYYPFGSHLFSDLTHYVRSGDFVVAMITDAQTIDEYAFALGALAHYVSDNTGHPAINRSTGLIYRGLRRKYGPMVTYEDSPTDHLKTEFGFDVIQVARGLYVSDNYHSFIGFEVSEALLERAFRHTYGIEITDIFGSLDIGVGTYRFMLGRLIPEMTKVAWDSKRSDIEKLSPGITRSRFVYALPRPQYEKDWDNHHRKPGPFARFLAFLFRLIPGFGPFKILRFKPVPDAAERSFLQSFDRTVANYGTQLEVLRQRKLALANTNLDTGEPTHAGNYALADKAYAKLLHLLVQHQNVVVPAELRANIASYFREVDHSKLSKRTSAELDQLSTLRIEDIGPQ